MAARKSGRSKRSSGKFIQKAINPKASGSLTKAVGGPPSKNLKKVRSLAKKGGKTGARARFYLNVLKPAGKKRKRKRKGK